MELLTEGHVFSILTQSTGTVEWKTFVAALLLLRNALDDDGNEVEMLLALVVESTFQQC